VNMYSFTFMLRPRTDALLARQTMTTTTSPFCLILYSPFSPHYLHQRAQSARWMYGLSRGYETDLRMNRMVV